VEMDQYMKTCFAPTRMRAHAQRYGCHFVVEDVFVHGPGIVTVVRG